MLAFTFLIEISTRKGSHTTLFLNSPIRISFLLYDITSEREKASLREGEGRVGLSFFFPSLSLFSFSS
jgi:hypothetical protein